MKITVKNGMLRVYGLGLEKRKEVEEISDCARWHETWKCWNIPMTVEVVRALRALIPVLPAEVETWLREQSRLETARQEASKIKDDSAADLRRRLAAIGVRFRVPMLDHQVISAAYALKLPACGLFLDTGTGKTATLSVVMQALYDLRGYRRFLVMAPKSILGASWAADVERFSWLRSVNISDPPARDPVTVCPICGHQSRGHVTWQHLRSHAGDQSRDEFYALYPDLRPLGDDSRAEKVSRVLDTSDAQVFLINPEAFKNSYEELASRDWDMFIVDESSCLKNPRSQTTKSVVAFGSQVKRRIAATATPRSLPAGRRRR